DLLQHHVARHLHGDHAPAYRRLDDLVLQVLLRLEHLRLHLLGLLEDRSEVGLLGHQDSCSSPGPTSVAPKSRLTFSMSSSAVRRCGSRGRASLFASNAIVSGAPVSPCRTRSTTSRLASAFLRANSWSGGNATTSRPPSSE